MSEPEECSRLIEVQRLWEGEIGAIGAGEVRRHLAHCSFCRAEYENWDRLSELLASGDLAQPLAPGRRRLLKEKLLEECAASLEQAPDAARHRGVLGLRERRWRMPARIALALASLATAVLVLVYAGRSVPPAEPQPTGADARPRAALPRAGYEAPPRPPRIARAAEPPKQPARPRPKLSGRAGKRLRLAVRPRRSRRALRMAAAPQERQRRPASRRAIAFAPAHERMASSRRLGLTAPQPIERIVIQVDGPLPTPPVEARSVTHLTIIAAGNPAAPGAKLTIVRSQIEEALP